MAVLLLAACGNGELVVDYTVPNEICGAPIEPASLESLLPGGGEFEAESENFGVGDAHEQCQISIDSKPIIGVTTYLFPDYSEPTEIAPMYHGGERARSVDIHGDDAALWDWGVVSYVRCFEEETDERGAYIGLRMVVHRDVVALEDPEERTAAIEEFARSLIAGLKQQHGCEV